MTIREVGAQRGSWTTLGDPEREFIVVFFGEVRQIGSLTDTAVIISEAIPVTTPRDGQEIRPSAFRSLEVIEQSRGHAPKRANYE